jgi:hypothetical protein
VAKDNLIKDNDRAKKMVKYLETVWHGVWLRAMEWECAIEQSLARRVDEVSKRLFFREFDLLFQGVDCVDHSEDNILKTLLEKRGSEIDVKIRTEPEEYLNNTRYLPITSCHLSKSSLTEITRRGKSSQICDSDCLSSDSGFGDIIYDFPTCLVRNIPPMCQIQTQKVMNTTSTNLQKHGTEKPKKKHLRTLKKPNIGCCKPILILIFLSFTFIILFLISNIKCYNNTCAIYINTHLQYYRGPLPL